MVRNEDEDRGQSAVLVAIALLVLVIFAAITVDISSAYLGRRTAQNAADGAALAAVRQLAYQYNSGVWNDGAVKIELNNFGELNGAGDSDGILANAVNNSVTGVYLDEGKTPIGVVGTGSVPADAMGVEATVFITTPAFFGGAVGRTGYPVQADATAMLELACGADCIVPVATHWYPFTTTAECYNIWNGGGPGNYGWLNWSFQGIYCHTGDCSAPCLRENMDHTIPCRSGFISVGELVAGTVGTMNDKHVLDELEWYIDNEEEFTVIVWDQAEAGGCDMEYRVAGFARMQLLGYQLSQGGGKTVIYGDPGTDCETLGIEPNNGVRLTAKFRGWVGGEGGSNCRVLYGSLRAPTLTD